VLFHDVNALHLASLMHVLYVDVLSLAVLRLATVLLVGSDYNILVKNTKRGMDMPRIDINHTRT
jgi:hypothetical protein